MKVLILFLITSCSIPRVYRATIGYSSNNTKYKSTTKDDSGNRDERKLCVTDINNNIQDLVKCGDGYEEDKGASLFDPWIEFYPTYFGKSNFGFSYFFAFNNSDVTLLDYPTVGDRSEIEIDRVSFNPILYYNIGDRFLSNSGGQSFRIGIGGALSYIYNFKLKRISDDEIYTESNPFKTGFSAFIEYNFSWFTFRVEHSAVIYDSKKFDDVESDELAIENNKASIYYSYYFR